MITSMTMQLTDSRLQDSRKDNPRGNPRAHSRSASRAMLHGMLLSCPACGEGRLYEDGSRLKVANYCPHCAEELYHHRANRMPPWFSAFLSAHFVVFMALLAEWATGAGLWLSIPAVLVWGGLTWLFMPRVKGAIVGLQWAYRMHGFQYAAMCKPRQPRRS